MLLAAGAASLDQCRGMCPGATPTPSHSVLKQVRDPEGQSPKAWTGPCPGLGWARLCQSLRHFHPAVPAWLWLGPLRQQVVILLTP